MKSSDGLFSGNRSGHGRLRQSDHNADAKKALTAAMPADMTRIKPFQDPAAEDDGETGNAIPRSAPITADGAPLALSGLHGDGRKR